MKSTKMISMILIVLITLGATLSVPTQALTRPVFGDFKYSINSDNTVTIDGYIGDSAEPQIPAKIEGRRVSTIGNYAFAGNLNIKKISIPDGITVIGEGAFANCTELVDVTIPETVNRIENAVFFSCTRLVDFSLPNSITYIGDGTFYYCDSLKNVTFPDSLTKIGDYVFGYCRSLETVTVNNNLKVISPQTFIGCYTLKTVKLHNNLKTIGRKAFMNCTALTDLILPNSIETVQDDAFNSCYNLSVKSFSGSYLGRRAFAGCNVNNIQLSENLSYIGYDAFADCVIENIYIPEANINLSTGAFASANIKRFLVSENNKYFAVKDGVLYSKDMTTLISYPSYNDACTYKLPEGVKTISNYAFYNSWQLNSIALNKTLEKIGDYSFASVSDIKVLELPETVREIGEGAFENCVAMTSLNIPQGVKVIKSKTFEGCASLGKLEVPDSVTVIEDYAFGNCTAFTSFEIAKGVREITALAFYGCCDLDTFKVNSENPYFSVDNNCVVSKDKNTIIIYPNNLNATKYKVADNVKKIESYAFINNSYLKELCLSENIESVGEYAFGFSMLREGRTPDRKTNFAVYVPDKCPAYDFAVKADLAVFSDKPVQYETELVLNAGEIYYFSIENTYDETVIYSVSDINVATVDDTGCITANNEGTTTVIATVGVENFVLDLEVYGTSNKTVNTYGYDLSDYRMLTADTYEQWEESYNTYNATVSMDPASNPNIGCYSGSEYVPIVAVQTGDFSRVEADYGEDIGQYYYISDGLSVELDRFKLNENLVLYSGTNDVTNITGTSSSLKDMRNTIGKTITDKAVISTSIDHGVAAYFGTGTYHTVLEIYAPKDVTEGAYIKRFSQYPYEQEILLDCKQSYKVLDAGVRIKSVTDFSGNTEEMLERYIKLIIVDDEDAPEVKYQKGDVNLDGKVDIKDATLVQKYLAKLCDFTELQCSLADFNEDSIINIFDVTAINKYIAKIS